MDITLDRPLMKAEFSVNQERNRLLGRIDVIKKELKSPRTLTIGIICTLAVWQIVLLIQLKLTKDKLKKLPEERVELVKPIAPGPPELPPLEKKSPRIDDKVRELTASSPDQQLEMTRNHSEALEIDSKDPLDSEIEKLEGEIAELDDRLCLKKQKTVNDLKQSDPAPAFKKSKADLKNERRKERYENALKAEAAAEFSATKIQSAARRCLSRNHFKGAVKSATVIQSLVRAFLSTKNFLLHKSSIVKIQALFRGMIARTIVKKEEEMVREKRFKIDSIVNAFKKAQGAEDKRVAFAQLKTHMVASRHEELEKTLELKEEESYMLDRELYQAALKNEKLAKSLVIAKFKLAQKNYNRIRLEKTKARDEARSIELAELKVKRLQEKQLSKS